MINSDGTAAAYDRDNKMPILFWPWKDAPDSLKEFVKTPATPKMEEHELKYVAHVPYWYVDKFSEDVINGVFRDLRCLIYRVADDSQVYIFVD